MTKRILGIDPGSRKTGIAVIQGPTKTDPPYQPILMDLIQIEDYLPTMIDLIIEDKHGKLDQIVIEDYIVRTAKLRDKRDDYVPVPVAKQIGQVEALARLAQIPIYVSSPVNKPVGYGWAFSGKIKYIQGKPNMDRYDAIAHAVFWMIKYGK